MNNESQHLNITIVNIWTLNEQNDKMTKTKKCEKKIVM